MALTYDQLSAITQRKYMPKLYDNIFDSNPILQRWKKKGFKMLDGGTSILVPLNYAQTSASGWYSGPDTLDTTDNQNITAAEYAWRQLYANVSITRDEELKNSGDSQILDLVKSKVQIAEKTLVDKLGTGIYSNGTTDPKSIAGFRNIISASNTVGGISQTTNSWWSSQVDSSTTTLSIAAMQSRFNAASVDSDQPSVIATTRSIYNSYYALLQPQQRFVDAESAKGGFQALMFNGKPVLADSHAPTSFMYFLNEDYLDLAVHKDENMRFEPFIKPVNQNVKTAKIYFMGALVSSNNRLQAVMSAITA